MSVDKCELLKESKIRCREYRISSLLKEPISKHPDLKMEDVLIENQVLIKNSEPFMKYLNDILEDLGSVIFLTDKYGCILDLIGGPSSKNITDELGLSVGTILTEESSGTTATGIVLKTSSHIQLEGNEHLLISYYNYASLSAPILDDKDQLIGTITIIGEKEKCHSHTMGMILATANSIKNKLESVKIQNKLNDSNYYAFTMMNNLSFGVFAVDLDDNIHWANDTACRLINIRRTLIINRGLNQIFSPWKKVKRIIDNDLVFMDEENKFNIQGVEEKFLFNAYPIKSEQNKILGYLITFRPFKRLLNLVNKYSGMHARYTFDDIINNSTAIKRTIRYAKTVANSPSTILLTGESGVGKEVFAQSIHNAGIRKDAGFIAVNCGAISPSLIESELFGYEEGAFTGAKKGGRPGKFELADGGTLFLDEIGEMSLDMQVKLLRTLQEGTITRVGGSKVINVDTRIIAATNKNLDEEVKKGNFRLDLYYRLCVIPITIPPLRERKSDIPYLVNIFLKTKASKLDKPIPILRQELYDEMENYDWPGNIRELENFIEKAVIMNGDISLRDDKFGEKNNYYEIINNTGLDGDKVEFKVKTLDDVEKEAIIATIIAFGGNMTHIAKALNIGRNTLYQKVKKYDIDVKKLVNEF